MKAFADWMEYYFLITLFSEILVFVLLIGTCLRFILGR